MMVDDEQARAAWRAKFEEHVTMILRAQGHRGQLRLVDTAMTWAMVQAYHEGVEGMHKRSSN